MLMMPILVGGATEAELVAAAGDEAAALPFWAKAVTDKITAATSENLVKLRLMCLFVLLENP